MQNTKINYKKEFEHVQKCDWNRTYYKDFNVILGQFIAQSIIDNTDGGSLLDLACGDGVITKFLNSHFSKIVGVDGSAKHLQIAKKRLPNIEFHTSLIEEFESEEKFDVVTLTCLLEHVIDPVAILEKTSLFLKENGRLIVHVPNALAPNRIIARLMGTLTDEYELSPFDIDIAGHRRSYDIELLKKDVQKANLKISSTGGVFYKMLSTPQINWFLENGLWEEEFGWGRVNGPKKDWKSEFCKACYEYGKMKPNECNVIYACITK